MKKVLVANRGEIALRIMRTCREMGIETVAVYSDVDKHAKYVQYADEAYALNGTLASESYLVHDKILDACIARNVDAIHPGYGFLSENAVFRKKVEKAGIIFIGPGADAMELMGSKLAAKEFARQYNIPMVPGTDYAITDPKKAIKVAKETGFPILIKASAGGGGKGMRIVRNAEELEEQMNRAISEAESAFGDGAVFVEKYVENPKHIEIQILCDQHGNAVHLFERECSIQRRHQKVIEEAPSAVVNQELRDEMGDCAVRIAQNCKYEGVGTVEFLYDQGKYYFLEMNTRLQVEHPVTEFITGVDLVREQINVARGEKLSFSQDDLSINGHSIEVRVYAENVAEGFLPETGKILSYSAPKGVGVRVDDGYGAGDEISVYYDPMISKLIVHAKDRNAAIERLVRAIDDYTISGLSTTLGFCRYVVQTDQFRDGSFTTNFVGKYMEDMSVINIDFDEEAEVAALVSASLMESKNTSVSSVQTNSVNNWVKNRKTY